MRERLLWHLILLLSHVDAGSLHKLNGSKALFTLLAHSSITEASEEIACSTFFFFLSLFQALGHYHFSALPIIFISAVCIQLFLMLVHVHLPLHVRVAHEGESCSMTYGFSLFPKNQAFWMSCG